MLACVSKINPIISRRTPEGMAKESNMTAINIFKAYTQLGSRIFNNENSLAIKHGSELNTK